MLEFKNVSFGYKKNKIVLRDISFKVEKGDFIGLIGRNGAGKTTIIKLILKKFKIWKGKILIYGKDIYKYSQREIAKIIGVVMEDEFTGWNLKVRDFVAFGRYPYYGKIVYDKEVENALFFTNTYHLKDREIFTLSSGERQRVFLAKILAQQPDILILDEPAVHLDLYYQIEIFKMLQKLNNEKKLPILVITHNFFLLKKFVKKIFILHDGTIKYKGKTEEILKNEFIEKVFKVNLKDYLINLDNQQA